MKLIAISTSAKYPSVAILNDDGTIIMKQDESGRPHSVSLMPLMDELLEANNLNICDMYAIAVDVGPGSFTGVRIGVSTANALAFSAGKKLIPVCSLAALKHLAPPYSTVLSLIDARNTNAYGAVYAMGKCIIEPCACNRQDIIAACECIGILNDDAVLVGDCFGQTDIVNAELVIKQALEMLNEDPLNATVDCVTPTYLRPSQAERMKNENIRMNDSNG